MTEELNRTMARDISISYGRSVRRTESVGYALRGPSPSIEALAVAISSTTLQRLREAAQDYGHLNHFYREADEDFAYEMTAAYGVSGAPIPLLIPLDNGFHIPFYAVLLNRGFGSATCWDSYHRGLTAIMARAAREMGVYTSIPVMYLRETLFDDVVFQDVEQYMRERERDMVSAPILEEYWPQESSSTFMLCT